MSGQPESTNTLDISDCGSPPIKDASKTIPEGTTTFMLQNLPPRFGVHEVIKVLDNSGLGDEYYNFFYMPHCKGATRSKCFAFINIPDSATAAEFLKRFQSGTHDPRG